MGVQAFGPEPPVECLDEGIVGRLAGPREVQHDIMDIGPEIQVPGDEFRALRWLCLFGQIGGPNKLIPDHDHAARRLDDTVSGACPGDGVVAI